MMFRSQAAGLLCLLALPLPAAAAGPTVIHIFDINTDGYNNNSGLIRDSNGALYGVAGNVPATGTGTGLVYRLSPPAAGQTVWAYDILYTFQDAADGSDPTGNLVLDASGALYGTTLFGGKDKGVCASNPGCGTVFKLTPPVPGQTAWAKTTLHIFHGSDGAYPGGGLLLGPDGSLYGTASNGGAFGYGIAFRLQPPDAGHASWHGSALYSFTGGSDGAYPGPLTFDGNGGLVGSTGDGGASGLGCNSYACGAVFRLTPPAAGQTAWSEAVLYSFSGLADGGFPFGKLSLDSEGSIYGTTVAGGEFGGSCTTYGCGLVFRLVPPSAPQAAWTYTDLHNFHFTDGSDPQGVVLGPGGNLYGGTQVGGHVDPDAPFGSGTLFGLAPPSVGQTVWPITALASPADCTFGCYAEYAPLLAPDGFLYYVTAGGPFTDPQAAGTILRVRPKTLQ